jgi:hypothetical protein
MIEFRREKAMKNISFPFVFLLFLLSDPLWLNHFLPQRFTKVTLRFTKVLNIKVIFNKLSMLMHIID